MKKASESFMKKTIAFVLLMMLLVSLSACGPQVETPQITVGTQPPQQTDGPGETTAPQETTAPAQAGEVFAFLYEEVTLCPGEAFDAEALPKATSTYQVPSCALEGTDNVYNYGTFEVTAFDEGKGEYIYSVYFLDPNLKTPEGLALGDTAAKARELYGNDYETQETAMVYTRGNTQLILIVQQDSIVSIEYRLGVE